MDVYIHTYVYRHTLVHIGLDNVKRIKDEISDPLDILVYIHFYIHKYMHIYIYIYLHM
jgi:hypothetical protein